MTFIQECRVSDQWPIKWGLSRPIKWGLKYYQQVTPVSVDLGCTAAPLDILPWSAATVKSPAFDFFEVGKRTMSPLYFTLAKSRGSISWNSDLRQAKALYGMLLASVHVCKFCKARQKYANNFFRLQPNKTMQGANSFSKWKARYINSHLSHCWVS